MTSMETFREWRGPDVASAPIPETIRSIIGSWEKVVYVFHDMELGKWMAVGINGDPAPDLVAMQSYDEGSVQMYRMPVRFLRLMEIEDFREAQK